MTLRRSRRSQQYITGRWPRGAQVRRTSGWSIRAISSMNSTLAPYFRAFFYARPVDASPSGDCLLVALAGHALGLLATPAPIQKDAPHLAGVIAHVKAALDHLSHALSRPQLGGKAVAGWALAPKKQQQSAQQ